jgi:hypothetical protein
MARVGKGIILRRNVKKFNCVHKRKVRKGLKGICLNFQKNFLDFMYRSLNSLNLFSLVKELEEAKSNGVPQDKHE